MKGLGKKRHFGSKMDFLRYSTGELGMISGLFSRRPFIKILFSHFTKLISRFRIIHIFREISAKFSRKFSKIFGENSWSPPNPPHPFPKLFTHTQPPKPWTHSELQIRIMITHKAYACTDPLCRFFHNGSHALKKMYA